MAMQQWDRCPVPAVARSGDAVGEWQLGSQIDLIVCRGQLRDALLRTPVPATMEFGDLQRLLLAFEELAANGLRHGRAPMRVSVAGAAEGWLIVVTDAATECPPTPVAGPDLVHGDFGLYLAARLCPSHGWSVCRGRKHVWALLRPGKT